MELVSESTVELVEHMGGDTAVVNSARVSFGKAHVSEIDDLSDGKLIDFLMRNRHGTPFESTVLTFRVETPIFVAREWFRHRVGSFNELSGRYKELPMRFFVPHRARTQEGKPGAYKFGGHPTMTEDLKTRLIDTYMRAESHYKQLLEDGVAKEQARLLLPLALMTQFYWTVNARSLMNFLSLRLAPEAMQEIREAALKVDHHFAMVMPLTKTYFVGHGMVAP